MLGSLKIIPSRLPWEKSDGVHNRVQIVDNIFRLVGLSLSPSTLKRYKDLALQQTRRGDKLMHQVEGPWACLCSHLT